MEKSGCEFLLCTLSHFWMANHCPSRVLGKLCSNMSNKNRKQDKCREFGSMQNLCDREAIFTSVYGIGEIDIRTHLKRYRKIVKDAVKSQKKILESSEKCIALRDLSSSFCLAYQRCILV